MLLAIDIGNTSTTFGSFNKDVLTKRWDIPTIELPAYISSKKFAQSQVVVCSVVPEVDRFIKKKFKNPKFITADNVPMIKVKLKSKKEIGADRVINVLATCVFYGAPALVVDFGSATTFDVLSAEGEYLGGSISAGIGLARDILHEKTAKLPLVEIMEPGHLIGRDTTEAILSGLVYGYASFVDGMVARFRKELGHKIKVVATGGFAKLIQKHASQIDVVDEDLTLKGLKLAFEKK